MASLSASLSNHFSWESSAIWSIRVIGSPSFSNTVSWIEAGGLFASWAKTMSSGVTPSASATSPIVGSRSSVLDISSFILRTLFAISFNERLTFSVPSSLRKRWISPIIIGTA
ncbi:hypothetical protein D3C72_2122140 [compost metagenome]